MRDSGHYLERGQRGDSAAGCPGLGGSAARADREGSGGSAQRGAARGSGSEGTFCPGTARGQAWEARWPLRVAGIQNFLSATGVTGAPELPTGTRGKNAAECGPRPDREGHFAEENPGDRLGVDLRCNSGIDLLRVDV